MLCWFIILLLTGGFSYLYYFLSGSLYLLPVWILCGFLSGLIVFLIYVLLVIFFSKYGSPQSKLKHRIIYPIVKWFHTVVRISLKVEGKENIPSETFVVYGNHKSMLDISLTYQAYHTVITAVAKKSLQNVPLCRRLMKGLHVVPIDRDNDREGVKNLLEAIGLVKGGFNFIIFPEGGVKSREVETMVALRAGAYKLATKPQATISPISIIGSSKLSNNCPKHHSRVKIIIHRPIPYEEYKDYNTTELGLLVGTIINDGVLTGKINNLPLNQITPKNFVKEEKNE